jgi:hypothetical protein
MKTAGFGCPKNSSFSASTASPIDSAAIVNVTRESEPTLIIAPPGNRQSCCEARARLEEFRAAFCPTSVIKAEPGQALWLQQGLFDGHRDFPVRCRNGLDQDTLALKSIPDLAAEIRCHGSRVRPQVQQGQAGAARDRQDSAVA